MKRFIAVACISMLLSCDSQNEGQTSSSQKSSASQNEVVNSIKSANGKYPVDVNTAEFLHLLENTVVNFRDMAKKRNPAINIYNEFSVLLNRNIERIRENCQMKGEGYDHLISVLEKISQYNKDIEGSDLVKARLAFSQIIVQVDELNTIFDYRN